jgi:hypothetical protein
MRYHTQAAKTARCVFFFVTFPSGIIVAADKYQPFVLLCKTEDKAKIVNK